MRRGYSSLVILSMILCSCAQADKFSLDASNPMALLGQIGWSLGLTPSNASAISGTQFVAVGDNCTSWTSQDGISWKFSASRFPGCSGGSLKNAAYGNGTWVAVGTTNGGGNCGIWSSKDDGETWVLRACDPVMIASAPTTKPLFGVTYGAGQFWAVGQKNQSSNGTDYFGQHSSDGIAWQYMGITDGSSYIGTDYYNTVSYNEVASQLYFSGVHSVNPEFSVVNIPSLANSFPAVGMASNVNQVLALKNGSIFIYGDADNPGTEAKIASSIANVGSAIPLPTAIQVHASIAVEGKDKIVLFGNSCSMDYYQFGLDVWHPLDVSVVSGCSGKNLLGAAYNSALDRYVVAGTANFFAYSTSGLPSAWTAVTPDLGGASAQAVNGVASKQR
ncbi:hypothetical protein EHQ05_11905 [Leptospira yasudae]|uniref:hypothetical protein n=1 Tax=Leptospira yasudae TaxID=2202201 RepID=UPI001083314C|nr:hypothetical protein [Leptospira yasudae]TGK25598.1 hypothetical protein EHQ05_11905 [Leptospira yasudae]TGM02697.1 hypothetical protein EHQ86_16620 [Leptospira yasudae]